MAEVKIRLFDNRQASRFAIELIGDQASAGQNIAISALRVIRANVTVDAAAVHSLTLPAAAVESDGDGGLKLKLFDAALVMEMDFSLPAGNTDFFSIHLDSSRGPAVRLTLDLNTTRGAQRSIARLDVVGHVNLNNTPATPQFSSVPVGFRSLWDVLPALPSIEPPALVILLPGQLPWPELRIPFNAKLEFPSVANKIRLPANSAPLASLPVRFGWDGIVISASAANVVVDISRLQLTGLASLFVSLKLTFKSNDVTIEKTGGAEGFDLAGIQFRQISDGCFGIDAKTSQLSQLVALFCGEVPNLVEEGKTVDLKIRIHAPQRKLMELRVDWPLAGSAVKVPLPGFDLTLPTPELLSMIVKPVGEDFDNQCVLAVTFPKSTAKLAARFGWHPSDSSQEKLPDSSAAQADKPLAIELDTKDVLSVALFNFSLSGDGRPRFMRKLSEPLASLADLEGDSMAEGEDDTDIIRTSTEPCMDTSLATESLTSDDVVALRLTGLPMDFPFLKNAATAAEQVIKLIGLTDPPAGPAPLAMAGVANSGLQIKKLLTLEIGLGQLKATVSALLTFDLERMGFHVDVSQGIPLLLPPGESEIRGEQFGLNFVLKPNADRQLFTLVIDQRNYAIKQAPGSVFYVVHNKATVPGDSLQFAISNFAITPKGLSLTAAITDKPAKLNGVETQFRFTEGVLQITDNSIAGFTIAGSGPLPPDLVGDAVADIGLQFAQENSKLVLVRGSAKIKGPKLLSCKATRFEFEIDALGLQFVREQGADHLYFTLSGKARYVMLSGDDSAGALAWLPGIEIQLIDCPLTGNARVISKHVTFLIELPKKLRFSFLGCFTMELRSIGFVPQFDKLGDAAAMRLGGQIMLGDTGDLLDAKIDLHDLYIALPEPGSFMPRLYLKSLGIRIAQGDTFALEANVDFYNGEEIEPGIFAHGFVGDGSVTIKGLPPIAASMAWLRVSRDQKTWSRAWFIYLEARRLSLRIPVVEIYIREIGIGFGYRYTLAAFKEIDKTSDVRQLLKKLKELTVTQGNLSDRKVWRVDLENDGEDPRWTVAARALLAASSAQSSPFTGYEEKPESVLPSLYILDAVLAVRSDLTFFLAGRAWLNTNYHDFNTKPSLRNAPLLNGFMMLSPKQSRFLANLSSNPGAEFGDHPPLPDFVKKLLKDSKFTATLLIEPGLIHYELGWPNQLQANVNVGPLTVQIRAGQIFRLSSSELVVGQSFLARGRLELKAEFSAGFFGAGVYALADVAYGMRYIGVIAFVDPLKNSAFYGAVGLDIRVQLQIRFWLRIKIGFIKISINLSVSIQIQFTAALQIGIAMPELAGALGTATISVRVMGRNLGFNVRVGINDGAVESARLKTERFLHIGLEAEEVEAVPGTTATPAAAPAMALAPNAQVVAAVVDNSSQSRDVLTSSAAPLNSAVAGVRAVLGVQSDPPAAFVVPDYNAGIAPSAADPNTLYIMLIPASVNGKLEREGFYAVPPKDVGVTQDFQWTFAKAVPATLTLTRWTAEKDPQETQDGISQSSVKWGVDWQYEFESETNGGLNGNTKTLAQFLRYAYLHTQPPEGERSDTNDFGNIEINSDPLSYLHSTDEKVEDNRVGNPASAAFEAAVRGAAEQFAAPYFKFDPDSPYDRSLLEACKSSTSVYNQDGKSTRGPQANGQNTTDEPEADQLALELRSSLTQAMTRDFFEYASLSDEKSARAQELRRESLLFRLGVIFKIRVAAPADPTEPLAEAFQWLLQGANQLGTIKQRIDPLKADCADVASKPIRLFNAPENWFGKRPPQFTRVRQYEHANTIAIDWRLEFPRDPNVLSNLVQDDPEHHLRYYMIRREHLDGNDPTVTFTLKSAEVLHRTQDAQGESHLVRLPTRFQLVDHFADQNAADVAALTSEGKLYLYTVTPVDIAGNISTRPLSVVARRLPADPPLVPTDGEVLVQYQLAPDLSNVVEIQDELLISKPKLMPPEAVRLRFSDPVEPIARPSVPISKFYLIFRREAILPIGFFGADESVRGASSKRLAISNARRLRNDIVIEIAGDIQYEEDRADSGRRFRTVSLELDQLRSAGILPFGNNSDWRAEGWSIFLQTESRSTSDAGVRSVLAPVLVRFEFVNRLHELQKETRQLARLEWIPKPLRLDLLPSVDTGGEVGFAKFPMPSLAGSSLAGSSLAGSDWKFEANSLAKIAYEQHPLRLRAVKVMWNQGPSGSNDHPLDLHARYQVYEFDVFANPGDMLRPTSSKHIDFPQWSKQAQLQAIQEVDLVSAKDLFNLPSSVKEPQAWEAWYPSSSRRLLLKREQQANGQWPDNRDVAYGPWYSFRDSYLAWPELHELASVVNGEFGNRLRRFHPFIEDVAALIGYVRPTDDFATYSVELGPQAARGNSQPRENVSNPSPVKTSKPSSALELLMQSAPAETDPYGWCILQQMGLSAGIRVRRHQDGEFLHGSALLAELHVAIGRARRKKRQTFSAIDANSSVRLRLQATAPGQLYRVSASDQGEVYELPFEMKDGANSSPIVVTRFADPNSQGQIVLTTWTDAGQDVAVHPPLEAGTDRERDNRKPDNPIVSNIEFDVDKFLHVEHLFQPGKKMRIAADESAAAGVAADDDTLSVVGISLRPCLKQYLQYQRRSFSHIELQPGTAVTIQFDLPVNTRGWFVLDSGQPMSPLAIEAQATYTFPSSMRGTLDLLLRGTDVDSIKILYKFKNAKDQAFSGTLNPHDSGVIHTRLSPIDWVSVNFTIPDKPLLLYQADEKRKLRHYIKCMEPTVDIAAIDTDDAKSQTFLSWLNRFFGWGGDVDTQQVLAETIAGPWIATGYVRTASPLPLTPDQAGRITYHRPIESQWGQAYRYLIRPRGRYELLWEELGRSRSLRLNDPNKIESSQKRLKAPQPGGVDVILPRIRTLAPPMVLSSRRLDLLPSPGTTSPPGKIWEVLIAEHPEQDLIDRNRTLVHRLEYRQSLQAMFRVFEPEDHQLGQVNRFMSFAESRLYVGTNPLLVPQTVNRLFLYHGQPEPTEIPIEADRRMDAVRIKINEQTASTDVEATVLPVGSSGSVLSLRAKASNRVIKDLALRTGKDLQDASQDLLTKPLDTTIANWDWPVSPPSSELDLPTLPDRPDVLTRDAEGILSLDLPLRSTEFSRGLMAIQYDALPFYYRHRLLLIAQAANVVSAITPLEHQDFEYRSALLSATMDASDATRPSQARTIYIPLGRLWDSLPDASQKNWPWEDPATAADLKMRPGGIVDTSLVYSIVLRMPGSGNEQVIAEYKFVKSEAVLDRYVASTPLPGEFVGHVVRIHSQGPQAQPLLETLLEKRPASAAPAMATVIIQSISSRHVFAIDSGLEQWPNNKEIFPRNCPLETTGAASPEQVAALQRLLSQVDQPLASALRELLKHADQAYSTSTCVGIEQLREIHDSVQIDAVQRKITWEGVMSPEQEKAFEIWEQTSLFSETFKKLREAIQAGGATKFTVDIVEPYWQSRDAVFNLEPSLKDYLSINYGLVGITGFMLRKHADDLLSSGLLSAADKASIRMLYANALNADLGGGELMLTVRRGSALNSSSKIESALK